MKQSTTRVSLSKRIKNHFLEEKYHSDSNTHSFNSPKIFGLARPSLLITGWGYNNNIEIEVNSGNKQLQVLDNSDERVFGKNKTINGNDAIEFLYVSHLPFSKKEITIKISEEGKLIYTASINNSFFTRLFSKILKSNNKIIKGIKILLKGIRFMWREHKFLVPPSMFPIYYKKFKLRLKTPNLNELFYNPNDGNDYREWIKHCEVFHNIEKFEYNPLISILMPVYNVPVEYLKECIDSVLVQSYINWELCISDDCSTDLELKEILQAYEKKDARIKVVYRSENGHISAATNSALEIATGDFIGLLDNDDILVKHALNEVVKVLNDNQNLDMIYSDEDKLDPEGLRCNPYFKPDFSPDTLLSFNYICHFTVLRKSIVEKIGGFRVGYEGVQDHDLFLRFTEQTNQIFHIPKVLYHWRMIEGSTAADSKNKSYINTTGIKVIEETLKRRGLKGTVKNAVISSWYTIEYEVEATDKISIIIPTRDHPKILKTCLESIYEKSTFKNFEIIVVDNGSKEKETEELFFKYKSEKENFRVLRLDCEFNYSYLNNEASKIATGEFILLLNNDTEIITSNWLELMLGYAKQEHIGIVGAKLLYPDNTIQHGGVVLGLGGVASHLHLNEADEETTSYGDLAVVKNFSALTAACILFSKEKFEMVNRLNEDLKVAYNDVDLNIKMMKKGYYNVLLPQVRLYHHESKSRGLDTTGEKYKRFLKEVKYMYDKWSDELTHDAYYNSNYSKHGVLVLDKIKRTKLPLEEFIEKEVIK